MKQAFQAIPGVVMQNLRLMPGVETVFVLNPDELPFMHVIVQTTRKLPDQNETTGTIVTTRVQLAQLALTADPTLALSNVLQQLYADYRKHNADGKNPLWKPE